MLSTVDLTFASCPNYPASQKVTSNIINLPVGLNVTDKDIISRCNILNKAAENYETKS